MASVRGSVTNVSAVRSRSSSLPSSITSSTIVCFSWSRDSCRRRCGDARRLCRLPVYKAMVQQASHGASATYAKDMERLSAKESLLLAFKDAGGFEALVTGKTTEMQRIDVNERITGLERLNPTPRPTTSSFLEGKWNFEWFGSGSPGLIAATTMLPRFPSTLAKLSKMDAVIKNGYANVSAYLILLNSIENKVTFSSKLSVEGPLRLKEEYVEATFDAPTVIEETLPVQLKGALSQAASVVQQLPAPIRSTIDNGLKVPLIFAGGSYQRLLMVSYLDEEILIVRGTDGIPEVLTRLDVPPSPLAPIAEYES